MCSDNYSIVLDPITIGGDYGPIRLYFNNPANPDGTAGDPINLTGSEFRACVRKKPGGPVLANFTVAIVSATAGSADMSMSRTETSKLTAGPRIDHPDSQYVWDLLHIDSLGRQLTEIGGTVPARIRTTE